jgi:hypothetical protein
MIVLVEKKLRVLDMSGFLVEKFHQAEKLVEKLEKLPRIKPPPNGKAGKNQFVYKRPFCNQFIEFCFQNFAVGVWSYAQKQNVDKLVDFIFGDLKEKLIF